MSHRANIDIDLKIHENIKIETKIIDKMKQKLGTFVLLITQRNRNNIDIQRLAKLLPQDYKPKDYNYNKGNSIVMCIRHDANPKIHTDINSLIVVGIHELAHVMTNSKHHTLQFGENFKFLLRIAAEMGICNPINFSIDSIDPIGYCATEINDNS
jgi:WLM domain